MSDIRSDLEEGDHVIQEQMKPANIHFEQAVNMVGK